MKKSVVILIGIIYVASIALVSFFGLKHKVFEEVVSVSSIEILNEGGEYSEKFGHYFVVEPDNDGVRAFRIEYRAHPDSATNNTVSFSGSNKVATVDKTGLVVFEKPGSITVMITANDGSGVTEKVTVISR